MATKRSVPEPRPRIWGWRGLARYLQRSPQALRSAIKAGRLPAPIIASANRLYWLVDEVDVAESKLPRRDLTVPDPTRRPPGRRRDAAPANENAVADQPQPAA